MTVAAGTIVDLNGFNQALAGLAGGGTVTNQGAPLSTLTIDVGAQGCTFAGSISDGDGPVAVAKGGPGDMTYSGVNTYSGGTLVDSGAGPVGLDGGGSAVCHWTGMAHDGSWANADNWDVQPNGDGCTVIFAATVPGLETDPTNTATNDDDPDVGVIESIRFEAPGYQIGVLAPVSYIVISDGGSIVADATDETISAPLELAGSVNFDVEGSLTLTVSGQITNYGSANPEGALDKTGGGTLWLTSNDASTYGGPTTIEAGTLVSLSADSDNGSGTLPWRTILTVDSGATLQLGDVSQPVSTPDQYVAGLYGTGRIINGGPYSTLTVDLAQLGQDDSFPGTLGGSTSANANLLRFRGGRWSHDDPHGQQHVESEFRCLEQHALFRRKCRSGPQRP